MYHFGSGWNGEEFYQHESLCSCWRGEEFQLTGITLVRSTNTNQFFVKIGCIFEVKSVDDAKKKIDSLSNNRLPT